MKIYRKSWVQQIPSDIDSVWDFFSRPENLNEITPKDMSFDIITDLQGKKMYENMLVEYKVSPFSGIRMTWVTEITKIKKKEYFIDEQRFGPYALWHHEHHFRSVDGGVEMRDELHYAIGWGLIGKAVNGLVVSKKIDHIFSYRYEKIKELF